MKSFIYLLCLFDYRLDNVITTHLRRYSLKRWKKAWSAMKTIKLGDDNYYPITVTLGCLEIT